MILERGPRWVLALPLALLAVYAVSCQDALAGVAELEKLRAALQAGTPRPHGLSAAKVLDGLRPEQRREALYLLSLVPAGRERLEDALEPLTDGQDELAEIAMMERLHLAVLSGDALAASALAESFRIAHPDSARLPQALLLLARATLQSGDSVRASEGFLQILLRHPATEEARLAQLGLGDCYLAEGKLAEAQAQYELAVKSPGDPSECSARLRLVAVAKKLGDSAAAAASFNALLEVCPNGLLADEAARRWPELMPSTPVPSARPTEVRTEALTPSPGPGPAPSPGAPAPETGGDVTFWVQIGAYGERANAERLAARLPGEEARLQIDEVVLSGRTIYKVLHGPYPSEDEATTGARELEKNHSLFGFVLRKAP